MANRPNDTDNKDEKVKEELEKIKASEEPTVDIAKIIDEKVKEELEKIKADLNTTKENTPVSQMDLAKVLNPKAISKAEYQKKVNERLKSQKEFKEECLKTGICGLTQGDPQKRLVSSKEFEADENGNPKNRKVESYRPLTLSCKACSKYIGFTKQNFQDMKNGIRTLPCDLKLKENNIQIKKG